MNRRIIKEARALLPAFGVALLATIVPSVIWRGDEVALFLFAVGCALMAASAFGNEVHGRTLPLLLSQPFSRRRIWFEKMVVLGVALAVCLVTVLIYLAMLAEDFPTVGNTGWLADHTYLRMLANDFPTVAFVLAAIPCYILCTTPCLTLITKNTLLGVLLSAGPPPLIWGFIASLSCEFFL